MTACLLAATENHHLLHRTTPGRPLSGSVYRRCSCRNPKTSKQLGLTCPKLRRPAHGTWYIRHELPATAHGTRRFLRRGGYATKDEAQKNLDLVQCLLGLPAEDDVRRRRSVADLLQQAVTNREPFPCVDETVRRLRGGQDLTSRITVGEWLDVWLSAKRTRRTTTNSYTSHIRHHLTPRIGHIRLDQLSVADLTEMFDAIEADNETIAAENQVRREQIARCKAQASGRPTPHERARLAAEQAELAEMKPYRRVSGPATRQRIRTTLRAALNAAIAQQLITFNPAAHVELPAGKRPKPRLWTEENVRRWRETGQKPSPVMVWTPDQFGAFLDHTEGHPLHAFYHLIAFVGLRRGEGVGQEWVDVHLDEGLITVSKEIVQDAWTPYESEPKTDGSAATLSLDSQNIRILRAHKEKQRALKERRLKDGLPWTDTGKVFTKEDGTWLHPDTVSKEFRRLYEEVGLPPINLRDLRHLTATLTYAGGGDIHTVKARLRHSTIVLTSDTYTSLLPETDRAIAEAAVRMVPRQLGEAVRNKPSPTHSWLRHAAALRERLHVTALRFASRQHRPTIAVLPSRTPRSVVLDW